MNGGKIGCTFVCGHLKFKRLNEKCSSGGQTPVWIAALWAKVTEDKVWVNNDCTKCFTEISQQVKISSEGIKIKDSPTIKGAISEIENGALRI